MLLRELIPGAVISDERPYETMLLRLLMPGAVISDERP
jgi:hypothetical protein